MTKDNRESKIMEILESICEPSNFVSYEYSPPKTVNACKLLLENHEEDIEKALMKNRNDLDQYICHEVSQACMGIDTTEKRDPSKNADIELQPSSDGKTSTTISVDPETGEVKAKKNKGLHFSRIDKGSA